ncbi:hypothetical protein PV328_011270 [Microctonus aethiopoides]|uniref:Uncharacterized protein n=1 Tax=Microctonus aethiopoides TaxID=144406 RepID=A0AA39C424_9HYME|nr:hypothetical protein PV328_011270 [Microctonus aethiopoides]
MALHSVETTTATTYNPEVEDNIRKEQDRRTVEEGIAIWRKRQQELLRHKHREQKELRYMQSNYSPWGKPGGGAPCNGSLKRKNVILEPLELQTNTNINAKGWTTKSLINRLHPEKMNPLSAIDPNKFFDATSRQIVGNIHQSAPTTPLHIEEKPFYNEQIEMYKLTGGVELVPLLTARHNYPHPMRYLSTDATKPGYTIDSLRNMNVGNREHMDALSEQIRRKREQALVNK